LEGLPVTASPHTAPYVIYFKGMIFELRPMLWRSSIGGNPPGAKPRCLSRFQRGYVTSGGDWVRWFGAGSGAIAYGLFRITGNSMYEALSPAW
jgi:hypothetical protein